MVPETLYNCSVAIDGRGYAGRATSMTPPKLKLKTDDYRAGGMDAPSKVDQGMEALEASFAMASMEYDVLKYFGILDGNAFSGNFRAAFKDHFGKIKYVGAFFRGKLTEVDPGEWKPGEKAETKYTICRRLLPHGDRRRRGSRDRRVRVQARGQWRRPTGRGA